MKNVRIHGFFLRLQDDAHFLISSIFFITLALPLMFLRPIGDDYCFISKSAELGQPAAFLDWFINWTPTISFVFPNLFLWFFSPVLAFKLFSISILTVNFYLISFISRNVEAFDSNPGFFRNSIYFSVFIPLYFVEPFGSRNWYSIHWGLTALGHFTPFLLGVILFILLNKNASRFITLPLAALLGQLGIAESLSFTIVLFIVFVKGFKKSFFPRKNYFFSLCIMSISSLSVVFLNRLFGTKRDFASRDFLSLDGVRTSIVDFMRLTYYHLEVFVNPTLILICLLIALTISSIFGEGFIFLGDLTKFLVTLFSSSLFAITLADWLTYAAPWHDLQIVVTGAASIISLSIYLFTRLLQFIPKFKERLKYVSSIAFVSILAVAFFASANTLSMTKTRAIAWDLNLQDSRANPESNPGLSWNGSMLEGDLESDWILACFERWQRQT